MGHSTITMQDEGGSPGQWYVRRGSRITGPYARAELERAILLGRIRPSDRVSPDGRTWFRLADRGDLIPAAMQDLQSLEGRARFETARRQADQRSGIRGGAPSRLQRLDPRHWPRGGAACVAVAAFALVTVLLLLVGWQRDFSAPGPVQPDCTAAPAPGVDWSYCLLTALAFEEGADLAGLRAIHASLRDAEIVGGNLAGAKLVHADLAGINLRGANLAEADLEGADLRGACLHDADLRDANLRNTDLRDADLDGARLDGAILDGAAWAAGEWCRDGSVGECLH